MRLLANLVRRVRLRILALRIRILNVIIAISVNHQVNAGRRNTRRLKRSRKLAQRYTALKYPLEGNAE
jgi:hypothetical protein